MKAILTTSFLFLAVPLTTPTHAFAQDVERPAPGRLAMRQAFAARYGN